MDIREVEAMKEAMVVMEEVYRMAKEVMGRTMVLVLEVMERAEPVAVVVVQVMVDILDTKEPEGIMAMVLRMALVVQEGIVLQDSKEALQVPEGVRLMVTREEVVEEMVQLMQHLDLVVVMAVEEVEQALRQTLAAAAVVAREHHTVLQLYHLIQIPMPKIVAMGLL